MSTTMRPTLQTVPESLPADHVTQPAQATPSTPSATSNGEKTHVPTPSTQTGPTPSVTLKPRSSSTRVSWYDRCVWWQGGWMCLLCMCQIKEIRCPSFVGEIRDVFIGRQLIWCRCCDCWGDEKKNICLMYDDVLVDTRIVYWNWWVIEKYSLVILWL